MSLIDEIFDESELLSDDDKAALAAEERGEAYEPEPEPPPEVVEKNRELSEAEQEAAWRADERRRFSQEIEAATSQQRALGSWEPRARPSPR